MIEAEFTLLLLTLLVGVMIVAALLLKGVSEKLGLPAIVAYLLLGIGLQAIDRAHHLQTESAQSVLNFLAELGLICLLFRVGLESNLSGLRRQLPRASVILVGDLLFSGLLGFGLAFYGLHWPLVTSLVVSLALIATSVGISINVWQEAKALSSPTGELLLDIAEMDDIAAIALMSLLFALLPFIQEAAAPGASLPSAIVSATALGDASHILFTTLAAFCLRVGLFTTLCLGFSRYAERPLIRLFEALEPAPDPMLTVAGIGFITAAIAGFLGFSVAVGAFFAGLVFSRDPEAVTFDASFGTLSELFVPFFFINIGLGLNLQAVSQTATLGLVISLVAIAGKLIGVGITAGNTVSPCSAVLLSLSMMPRAEITMVVLQKGQSLGDGVIPPVVFGAMVTMTLVTCSITPLCLRPLLRRWRPYLELTS